MASLIPSNMERFSTRDDFNKRILITGGTGFIGRRLVEVLLSLGASVTVLSRAAKSTKTSPVRFISKLDQVSDDEKFDVVINLAGEPLASGRWNRKRKQEFIASRVSMTHQLKALIDRLKQKPELLINGSAIGFYGPHQDEMLGEDGEVVPGFSHELCRRWEEAAKDIETSGVRVCRLRIGVVLGRDGGPYQQLSLPFRLGASVGMGSGAQWISWIHRDDLIGIMLLMMQSKISGAFNGTAPEPVTNDRFCEVLRNHFKTLIRLRMPAFMLKIMVGEMAEEILLSGQRVLPQRSLEAGYEFKFPTLDDAIADLEV